MLETAPPVQPPLHAVPTADDYAAAARRRVLRFALGGSLLALAVAGSYVGISLGSPILPLVLLLCVMTPVLLWRYPHASLYVVFAAACVIEEFPIDAKDSITDLVPFFWNVNTIFQRYLHMANFKAVPINVMELILIVAVVCSTFRAVYSRGVSLRGGPLLAPILIYIGFVAMGWVNGMATHGDLIVSLQEVRSQFYFLLTYLIAVNVVRERRQLDALLWIMVIGVGIKGIMYTVRRFVTEAGQPISDGGVGSHEEAFLFNAFMILLVVLVLCGTHKRLRNVMWCLLPFVFLGDLACNRRAGTAAMVIALVVLLFAAYRALPVRRRSILIFGLVLGIGFSIYYPLFKNSDSFLAQPARAIRSQFNPDARDTRSNAYRDAENADLYATIKSAPIQGYGYGKRMFHAVPIDDISTIYVYWDVMTHNQVLWVWMRVGSFGFLAFWLMISAIIIYACQIIQREEATAETKTIGLFTLLSLCMLVMFGLLDMQFSFYRDMLFMGCWVGVLSAVTSLNTAAPAAARRFTPTYALRREETALSAQRTGTR